MWQLLIPVISKVLDQVLPDTKEAEAAKARLLELQISGELQQLTGQMEINKAEAANPNIFVSGWRPSIGWICSVALGYTFIVYPLLQWYAVTYAPHITPPALVTDNLFELILGMLGMSGLRSWEKLKGVAR